MLAKEAPRAFRNELVNDSRREGILVKPLHRCMTIALTILGIVLILAAVRDIFHTLFNPSKQGDVSEWIARGIWRGIKRTMPRALIYAGPIAFVTVVLYWTVSMILGFALIYFPRIAQSFAFTPGLDPTQYQTLLGSLDASIGSLITLSTGIYSKEPWIQLVMGTESIFGFGLLTASVSWILSIYPVLEHRKSLAHEASLMHFAEMNGIRRLREISESDLHDILLGFAGEMTTSRNELIQFPITYYFHENEGQTSLAAILPYLADIAAQNVHGEGAVALAATALGGAIDDYLKFVGRFFLDRPFTNRYEMLGAFAADHLRNAVRSPAVIPRAA
jgi:hypothetical protein